MRKNLPVSSNEYVIKDRRPLVSMTDLKGRITYVNPRFVEVSGFSEEELLGSPHNVVRHPDMPPAAFADLWATLKAGQQWSGMVKNRRKNGDFYWVHANVSPVFENGRVVAYMSVRTAPAAAQVAQAQALYQGIAAGTARVRISQGEAVPLGLQGLPARVRAWPIGAWLGAGLAVLGALFVGLAAAGGMRTGILAGAALGLLLCLAMALWVRAAIVAPLRHALDAARVMAGGDLTVQVHVRGGGEIGQLMRTLRQMSSNLVAAVGDVHANVIGMRSATAEIAAGNADLAARTEAQAARLEETASSVEQLAAAVASNAEHARQANQLASLASEVAEQGSGAVARVVDTMRDIDESSRRIADITSLIDGIAFQTNLLALNAAVEAARAGELGKGFAVVATEVRALAQRSAAAAQEIKTLVDDSLARVRDGAGQAGQARQTMGDLLERTRQVAGIVDEIAQANAQQSAGIAMVNKAVHELDRITHQNAALVVQAATAARALERDAAGTARAVGLFKLAA
ncbi:methyl-accepting chemotaxis protein [Massilia agilis]|uniref:Methyl-accepting chemotaxis protein n=1 Tax=Massilia agilis TaxID=1811226 RepID=A0ABT2D7E3_9BURK|nr:PAS domain-containing methyl-accepting chemotaxis protein [Massilia agilis]MCS0807241.1 methyl-accepting chemotaxis protein [Massilia agilis]